MVLTQQNHEKLTWFSDVSRFLEKVRSLKMTFETTRMVGSLKDSGHFHPY